MSHLARILLPFLLFILLAACSVIEELSINEDSPLPTALPPSNTAEVVPSTALTTPLSAEPVSTIPSTPPDLVETAALPTESARESPTASVEITHPAAVSPQPINLIPALLTSADFSMQSTTALTTTREGILLVEWSPDGTRLLFTRLSNLWLYNVATNEQQLLLDNVRTATWSPDGQRIAYIPYWNQALGREDRRVLVLDLATKQSVEIGDTQTRGPIISHLVWTPDRGILLATPHEILAYPETTMAAPHVTVFAIPSALQVTDDTWVALAPKGRHALITSGSPQQRMISFVVDGSIAQTVTSFDPESFLWTPDGQQVVFEHDGEFLSIYRAQGELLATSTPETLKLRPHSWSPDGTYLVYSTNGGGTGPFQAYIVKPGGSESIELAAPFESSYGINDVLWSPSNRHIAYTIDDYTAVGEEPERATTYLMIATRPPRQQ